MTGVIKGKMGYIGFRVLGMGFRDKGLGFPLSEGLGSSLGSPSHGNSHLLIEGIGL